MKKTILNINMLVVIFVLSTSMGKFHKKANPVYVTRKKSMIEFYVKDFPKEGAIHRSFNDDLKNNDNYTIKFRFDNFLPKQFFYLKNLMHGFQRMD